MRPNASSVTRVREKETEERGRSEREHKEGPSVLQDVNFGHPLQGDEPNVQRVKKPLRGPSW